MSGHFTWKEVRDGHTPRGATDMNDQIKKLVGQLNDKFDKLEQPASVQAATPTPAPIVTNNTTIKENPFKQAWYKFRALLNNDVRQVYVDSPLTLTPLGEYGVELGISVSQNKSSFLPATFGGWTCLNEVMPVPLWGNAETKFRLEMRFAYAGGSRSIVFRFSPNPNNTDGSDFVIEANSDGTSTNAALWCLKCTNVNEVTMPAPPINTLCCLYVEFDATNPGTGKAQWLVGLDTGNGAVAQTLTNVNNGGVATIPQAMRLTFGANYSTPSFGTSTQGVFPPLPFDGVICERRGFIDTTGSFTTEPSYTKTRFWYDPAHTRGSTFVESVPCTLSQGSSGQKLIGSCYTYILTGNSGVYIYPDTVQNLSGLTQIGYVPTYGFPGTLLISSVQPISMPLPHYNVTALVVTPNLAILKNLAYPEEDRYALFNIPAGNANPLVYPQPTESQMHTLKGITTVEQFIGANQ
ncbi:MAG: hypothetical protein KGJ13_02180 [Patescibacteria group bacterium]|nr:hypothetical protein [Patescibacteria group bacterium]